MEQPGHGGLLSGDLGRLYERTGEVLASRDKLTAGFASAKGGSSRERVLLKAMVLFLREERAGEGELEDFTRELKQMRMPLIKLGREYNSAPDEKKIEIRDSILRLGLPGDPVCHRGYPIEGSGLSPAGGQAAGTVRGIYAELRAIPLVRYAVRSLQGTVRSADKVRAEADR